MGIAFEMDEVLVWGNTYYSTVELIKKIWKPEHYLFIRYSNKIEYDLQGNGYQIDFDTSESELVGVSSDGKWIFDPIDLNKYSKELNGP